MRKIELKDVRKILTDMGNTYVSLLTDEELSEALLQDDLGLKEEEIDELVVKLEELGCFFVVEPVKQFLQRENSIPVYLLSRICEDYTVETKPCIS